MAFPGAVLDVGSLSDADFQNMQLAAMPAAPAPASEPAPAGATEAAPDTLDLGKLTDAQFAQLQHHLHAQGKGPAMGALEAALRSFYKHGTFGLSPGADRKLEEQAAREHPYIDVATAIPAFVGQAAIAAPIAATLRGVQGANALASVARGTGKAIEVGLLPNTEARTALTATRTGAKVGGNLSAIETAGSDLTNPDKSWTDTARDVALSYGAGTALGAGLGLGGHGLSRAAGAVANRTMPDLAEAQAAARAPEAQGVRDFVRHAGYDDVSDAKLRALRLNLAKAEAGDPVLAARYADLNLSEALKASELKPTSAGELKPEVITTRNLDDLTKHWANTEGRGQNIAAEAFGSRKNEMSAKMQADIDTYFGTGAREEDAVAQAAKRAAISKRYDKMAESGQLVQVDELANMGQLNAVFKKALEYAGTRDTIANPGSPWASLWSGGKLGDTVVTLSPNNVLDIHHYLVMNAKPTIGRDPAIAKDARDLKEWFSKWADSKFSAHKSLREDWAQVRRIMEATDRGGNLPVNAGPGHPDLIWLRREANNLPQLEKTLNARQMRLAVVAADPQANPRSVSALLGTVTKAQKALETRKSVVEEFRKAYGDARKLDLQQRGDNGPAQITKAMTTQAGKRVIMELLPENGRAYIESLYNKALQQRLGNTLYGGSDTAFKLQKRETLDALSDAATGLLHMRPKAVWDATRELASSHYRQHRADLGNEMMARQGVSDVKAIVEAVLAQKQLSQTAHPLIRNPVLRSVGPVGAAPVMAAQQKPEKRNPLLDLNRQQPQGRRGPPSGPSAPPAPPQRANQ